MRKFLKSAKSPVLVLCSLFLVLGSTGCGEETPTAPTPTEPVLITDTYSGTLNKNGAVTHRFTTASAGTVTATVADLTPDAELVVGFGVGLWNGSVCTVSFARDEAVKGTVIFANVNGPGELCVRIFDVGRIGETTDYTVTVVHP